MAKKIEPAQWLSDDQITGDLLVYLHSAQRIPDDIRRNKPLPKYLQSSLKRYQTAWLTEIAKELLVEKLVKRHSKAGKPKSQGNRAGETTAYEATGKQLGRSAKSIERWEKEQKDKK